MKLQFSELPKPGSVCLRLLAFWSEDEIELFQARLPLKFDDKLTLRPNSANSDQLFESGLLLQLALKRSVRNRAVIIADALT